MVMSPKGELPLLKQCVEHIKEAKYTPTAQAKVLVGGIVESQIDPFTGKPVKVVIDPTEKVINSSETITIPKDVLSGASADGNA